ncbi:hypothetical protein [uncultured Thomasclavelia sp.]|uniref:hypothetical protein n=1 Tax=uncultured Thomasclavelia sp. TaxID=3025759 RepID=UPI0025DA1F36|nr:hypothetical protein [uncultured Thomasclavelia sp.]
MNELQQAMQMDITGGSVAGVIFFVVIGTAVYKMYKSSAGRISIPRIISIEWR